MHPIERGISENVKESLLEELAEPMGQATLDLEHPHRLSETDRIVVDEIVETLQSFQV